MVGILIRVLHQWKPRGANELLEFVEYDRMLSRPFWDTDIIYMCDRMT